MSKQADISLLIGAAGGYTANGESATLITSQLKSQFANGLSINVNSKKIVDDIQLALSKKTFNIAVNTKGTAQGATSTGQQQNGTPGTSASKSAIRSFEQEYISLANKIGQAYQASQNFNSYVSKMSPDQIRLFNKEIQQITQNLNQAIATGHKLSFAEANEQIKALKYNVSQLKIPNSYQQYVNYNNAMRVEDQNRWLRNVGLDKNYELEQMNAYYRELEKNSQRAAASQIRDSQNIANNIANAKSQLANFNQYLQRIKPTGLSSYSSEISNIRTLLSEAISTGDVSKLNQANTAIKSLKSQFVTLGYEGGNALTYLKDKLKTFSVYLLSSTIAFRVISGIRNTISTVYDLDEALTNLRIVMNSSEQDAKQLLYTYNQMAQELGSTTKASQTPLLNGRDKDIVSLKPIH